MPNRRPRRTFKRTPFAQQLEQNRRALDDLAKLSGKAALERANG